MNNLDVPTNDQGKFIKVRPLYGQIKCEMIRTTVMTPPLKQNKVGRPTKPVV